MGKAMRRTEGVDRVEAHLQAFCHAHAVALSQRRLASGVG